MLALALGIGATTTMFGLLNAVALRPLPYPESDRLVELWGNVERAAVERRGTSIPDYIDWRDEEPLVRSDGGLVATTASSATAAGEPDAGRRRVVVGQLLRDARRRAAARPDADRRQTMTATRRSAAVIGERLWERAFNRDPNVIGRSMRLGNWSFTIVGVAPAAFTRPIGCERGLGVDDRSHPAQRRSRSAAAADSRRSRGSRPA